MLPGFIDTHVHSAQLDVIGSWGAQLLDWLETYTFPAEHRMVDPVLAQQGSTLFLDALLAHGSTSAVVFPTVHKASVDALFEGALERGMRLIAGKVLMDRHAPKTLCDDIDDVDGAERDCHELIERWHGRGRLAYAVTPRFAPTSSDAQLAMAGRLLPSREGLYMQTHVAENPDEVRWVAELFPDARSYLDVYERHGLLNARSVLAHGIWLDDADRGAAAGARRADRLLPQFEPVPGQRPVRLGRGRGRRRGHQPGLRRRRRHQPVDAAHDGRRLQGAGAGRHQAQRLGAAACGHARRGAGAGPGATRSVRSRAAPSADLCVWDWAGEPGRAAPAAGGARLA